mgnify:CR=1 FL=1
MSNGDGLTNDPIINTTGPSLGGFYDWAAVLDAIMQADTEGQYTDAENRFAALHNAVWGIRNSDMSQQEQVDAVAEILRESGFSAYAIEDVTDYSFDDVMTELEAGGYDVSGNPITEVDAGESPFATDLAPAGGIGPTAAEQEYTTARDNAISTGNISTLSDEHLARYIEEKTAGLGTFSQNAYDRDSWEYAEELGRLQEELRGLNEEMQSRGATFDPGALWGEVLGAGGVGIGTIADILGIPVPDELIFQPNMPGATVVWGDPQGTAPYIPTGTAGTTQTGVQTGTIWDYVGRELLGGGWLEGGVTWDDVVDIITSGVSTGVLTKNVAFDDDDITPETQVTVDLGGDDDSVADPDGAPIVIGDGDGAPIVIGDGDGDGAPIVIGDGDGDGDGAPIVIGDGDDDGDGLDAVTIGRLDIGTNIGRLDTGTTITGKKPPRDIISDSPLDVSGGGSGGGGGGLPIQAPTDAGGRRRDPTYTEIDYFYDVGGESIFPPTGEEDGVAFADIAPYGERYGQYGEKNELEKLLALLGIEDDTYGTY